MGGNTSTPVPPVLEKPWRRFLWNERGKDLEYINIFKPGSKDVDHIRVLLYGPVGGGKSSFITSVSSILQGKLVSCALANSKSNESFTTEYECHTIPKNEGGFYSFLLCDTMGLEEGDEKGVHLDDIKLALKGHMKDKYKCKDKFPLMENDPEYNPCPTPNDKVHVLVCVISANSTEITPSILSKMKQIRRTASDLGIPQLALLTQIDEACPESDKDLKNVFRSRDLKEKVKEISTAVGFPENCIVPVKNYSKDNTLYDDMDELILKALRQALDFGDDFAKKMEKRS